ncbi:MULTISPECIES: DUF6022 family protein [Paenibacillus]|uniref:DUF6022 family protein n=1 Tax=Paenibacillus TaxID=44249 RepID=UPI0022B8B67A|nr:DUF6022 family protein [Paenibacillus caseinilyticus]MCZ8520481.1 DUF6022 family protein [Paenibacillus caseinilyticus]
MSKGFVTDILRVAEPVLSASWKTLVQEKNGEYARMYEEYGERAYGVWAQELMAPVADRLRQEGYAVKGGFNRTDSVENWGPPEERERCIWYTVKREDGEAVGSLVLQLYHSHIQFHLPRPPQLLAIEATRREDILASLAIASTRVPWNRPAQRTPAPEGRPAAGLTWEYATDVALADTLVPGDDGQLQSWAMDEALSHWGRHGWELVTVTQRDGRMIGLFKRPCPPEGRPI